MAADENQPDRPVCRIHPDGFNPDCDQCSQVRSEWRRIAEMLEKRFHPHVFTLTWPKI